MRKLLLILLLASCNKEIYVEKPVEEIATVKPESTMKGCFAIDSLKNDKDLQLVINAEEDTLYPDGSVDSNSYFFTRYGVRSEPIRLTQNHIVTAYEATYNGWTAGEIINKIRLQCLVENISAFGCQRDWLFNEYMGKLVGSFYEFNGLFEFEIYEKGNGNNWKLFHKDVKKRFFPSIDKVKEYMLAPFCYYQNTGDRAIQAQAGDFYYNDFRLPNYDGIYKIVLKFNPLIKGCRAIKETNYSNNEKTVYLQIYNGSVIIL